MNDSRKIHLLLRISGWSILIFLLLPSLIVVPIAFGNSDAIVFPPNSVGIAMFRRFFTEPGWIAATAMSIRVACWVTLAGVMTGVPAAYGISRGHFRGKRWLTLFLISPLVIPAVVTALGLYIYFARIGVEDGEVRLVLSHTILALPFVLITALAGLHQVDPTIEKAATLMGASRLTVLWRVTLPLISPSILAGAILAFLLSFDEVVISWFVAKPTGITLPVKMFASIQFDVSAILAAISTMLTVVSCLVCVAVTLIQRTRRATT